MAERPDLDAIGEEMGIPSFWGSPRAAFVLNALFAYCRDLEVENKRLRKRAMEREVADNVADRRISYS